MHQWQWVSSRHLGPAVGPCHALLPATYPQLDLPAHGQIHSWQERHHVPLAKTRRSNPHLCPSSVVRKYLIKQRPQLPHPLRCRRPLKRRRRLVPQWDGMWRTCHFRQKRLIGLWNRNRAYLVSCWNKSNMQSDIGNHNCSRCRTRGGESPTPRKANCAACKNSIHPAMRRI